MGIIKQIILVFFIFFFGKVSAQKSGDSLIVKGNMYITHIVQPNETYISISNKYNVSIDELKLHNKNSRLYFKQKFLIPIKSTLADRLIFKDKAINKRGLVNYNSIQSKNNFDSKDTLDIAVLLPFYIAENDSLLSYLSKSNQFKEDIYKKSYMALQFLEGLIVASDSISKSGKQINLYIFDTKNDTNTIKEIIATGILESVNLIIGPVFTRNLSIVTKMYGRDKNIKIISPLSRNSNVLKHGNNIFQIIPPIKNQIDKIYQYISKQYKKEKVLILAKKEELKYANNYKSLFKKEKRKSKICIFDGLNTITKDTICQFLSNHDYLVLIPSNDRSFVSKIISSLGTIDTNMIVFGLDKWHSFENMDIETLMKLNVHFPDPYFFNYDDNMRFISLFQQNFYALPDKYAQIAFKQAMYFFGGKGDYRFKKYYTKGGFANYKFPIVMYKDYSIKKVMN